MNSLPKMMQAVSCPEYGGAENITLTERLVPSPKDNELLVRVSHTAITTADTMMRAGIPKFARLFLGAFKPSNPFLGTGYSGEVVAIGKNIKSYKPGDMIFGETGLTFGANAEYVCVDAAGVVFPKPESLPHEQAACFCDGPLTSYNFIKEIANAQHGQAILINGGAGSLGTAAIQIAKILGCRVTATSSPENFAFLKSLGADEVIDYKSKEFAEMEANFDVIYDTVGKLNFDRSKRLLSVNGKFVSPVLSVNLLWSVLKQKIKRSKMSAAFSATGMKKPSELTLFLEALLKMFENDKFTVHIENTFSLKQVSVAHGLIDAGHKKGNFVARLTAEN